MQSDQPNPATSDYPSLTSEQRERRARVWARTKTAARIAYGSGAVGAVIMFIAVLLWFKLDEVTADKFVLTALGGFLAVYMSIGLVLATLLFWSRPSWPTALWGMRILMVGMYALFLAAIGVPLLMVLGSLGVQFSTEALVAFLVVYAFLGAFFFVALIVAFSVTMMEQRSQQAREQRATLPHPS